MPSRGMGIVSPGKLPKKMRRKDNPDDFDMYAEGGQVGLYANINAKRKRIKAGAKERMARKGEAGRPTAAAFKVAAKTAKKK